MNRMHANRRIEDDGAMTLGLTPSNRHRGAHVCPWWAGYLLVNPLRRLLENPARILAPDVREGMTVLDPGCGMGYFTLPLARMVGPRGRVLAVDLQPRMIRGLETRLRRAGLQDRVEASVCDADDLRLASEAGSVDLITAIHVIHEAPDARTFLEQCRRLLREGGKLLVLEPRGHVKKAGFDAVLGAARDCGFKQLPRPEVHRGHAAQLLRAAEAAQGFEKSKISTGRAISR